MQLKTNGYEGEDDRGIWIRARGERRRGEGIYGESHGRGNGIEGEDFGTQGRKSPVDIREGGIQEQSGGGVRGGEGGGGGAAVVWKVVSEGEGSGEGEGEGDEGGENGEGEGAVGKRGLEGRNEGDLERGELERGVWKWNEEIVVLFELWGYRL